MDQRRAVFLDLNGTLVTPVLAEQLTDLRLIDGVQEGVGRLCRAGFVCPVVTVQSRIEKGLFSEAEFHTWFEALARSMATWGTVLTGYSAREEEASRAKRFASYTGRTFGEVVDWILRQEAA